MCGITDLVAAQLTLARATVKWRPASGHIPGLMLMSKGGGWHYAASAAEAAELWRGLSTSMLKCNKLMLLTWRAPDTDYGSRYQRQTFSCPACKHRIERSVDVDGNPPELERY